MWHAIHDFERGWGWRCRDGRMVWLYDVSAYITTADLAIPLVGLELDVYWWGVFDDWHARLKGPLEERARKLREWLVLHPFKLPDVLITPRFSKDAEAAWAKMPDIREVLSAR